MSIKTGNERGHHAGTVGILSGAPMVSSRTRTRPTPRRSARPASIRSPRRVIGKTTRFKSLEVGISKRVDGVEGTTLHYLSHNGPDSANPPEYDPSAVFNRIFGAGFTPPAAMAPPTMPVVDVSRVLQKSVLDVVHGRHRERSR